MEYKLNSGFILYFPQKINDRWIVRDWTNNNAESFNHPKAKDKLEETYGARLG